MGFFVTSVGRGDTMGNGTGGDLGGLAGADAICQQLADAAYNNDPAYTSKVWRAYLSNSVLPDLNGNFVGTPIHARNRIGPGPWRNFQGQLVAQDVALLHTNGIAVPLILTERGTTVPSEEHDIITGTRPDGTAYDRHPDNPDAPGPTCWNWTASDPDSYVIVGHSDWEAGSGTWNSSHDTTCNQAGLNSTLGTARMYCFEDTSP